MPFIRGGVAGTIHRLFISPRIGALHHKTQSVSTPAAGITLAFLPLLMSIMDMRKRGELRDINIMLIVAYVYMATFLGYGGVVVATILAGIGGKKE